MNLPIEFQKKMKELLGDDYENYLGSMDIKIGQTLRVNPLKIEPAELFRRFDVAPVPWCENGAYYQGEERLSMHPYYYAGLYYLQEPSAMAPAAFLPVEPGDRVLDLCAAPGGKTTVLAAKLQGQGFLLANDISISRCRALQKNIQMAGITNAMVICEAPQKLAERFPNYFDKILIDAPCSGEGMFRKEPSMAKDWSPSEVEKYSKIQKEILLSAAHMLKPGGCLLYSTCTYSPEENEQVVETLLTDPTTGDADFSLLPLPKAEGVDEGHPEWSRSHREELRHCRRFWNHRVTGEGQFAALLQKKEGTLATTVSKAKRASRKIPEELEEFLSGCSFPVDRERLLMVQERVFLVPEEVPDMKGIRVVSSGLHLGDCKKKRFEPGQAFAMALRPEQYANVLSLESNDLRVEKYLKCETIEGEVKDGWVLICVENYPLGWGKAKNGRIKNKYPAAWRKL